MSRSKPPVLTAPIEAICAHLEAQPYTTMPSHIRNVASDRDNSHSVRFIRASRLLLSDAPHALAPLTLKLALAYGVQPCHILPSR